ncbi:small multi-drug export protein [Effusibacillus lacus]|uniref:Small multi-drug export protein n=1 Tax=Effusibacillus lacus TaxID=1348429 RepID=A0A292YLT3_9BACL|nr:small multi-drug export protein [Effusibacillus lacus]TCS73654.1 putative small multi-drug export protein [Effusibacillus lacus]GAX89455.1 hypothetical protein [Effusibacillus lacus]
MEDLTGFKQNRQAKQQPSFLLAGVVGSLLLLGIAAGIGLLQGNWAAAASVIASSLLLEVVIGAAGSVPLGFDPVSGATVAAASNLAPVPLLLAAFERLVSKWRWFRRKAEKAEKWSKKYGKYGVWVLAPMAPLLGAYVCVAIGIGLRWQPVMTFVSITVGVVVSAFLTTFGGNWLVG